MATASTERSSAWIASFPIINNRPQSKTYRPICASHRRRRNARDRRIFRAASRCRGVSGGGGERGGAASPQRGPRSTPDWVDQNISSTMERRRLLMTEARVWLSSWSARSVLCSLSGLGHMGATPQPKATIVSRVNQRRRCRNSGVSNVSGSNQRCGESIDTVGVTGRVAPAHCCVEAPSEPCLPLIAAHGSSSPRGRVGVCVYWSVPAGRSSR